MSGSIGLGWRGIILAATALIVTTPVEGALALEPPSGLARMGYRVVVTPEIVEADAGGVMTRSLTWSLRAVYMHPEGFEVLVRPAPDPAWRGSIADTQVRVNRAWRPGDVRGQSQVFRELAQAGRHFERVRRAIEPQEVTQHGAAPASPPIAAPAPTPAPPPPAPRADAGRGTCEEIILSRGHHPMHLESCRGVESRCAVAVLRAGHHPEQIRECKGAALWCAEKVIAAGHPPSELKHCTPSLSRQCAETVLSLGHHPLQLDQCRDVDDVCAVALLRQGHHPQQLTRCRQVAP